MRIGLNPEILAPVVGALCLVSVCWGQTSDASPLPSEVPSIVALAGAPSPSQPSIGTIRGTILDQSGAVVAGALIDLNASGQPSKRNTVSDGDGLFSFSNASPGSFQLTITASGFAPQTFTGVLHPGEIDTVPIALGVAEARTEVEVQLTQVEVAQEEIKVEEKQRVLGVIPNFYVSYLPDPEPLTSKQKFELAWKTSVDPFTLVVVGGAAGIAQAQNHFSGYGQGAEGYAKRYGAAYADTVAGNFIGAALLPSLFKQDPRYFYKGTGNAPSRFTYALASAVICKGDNGHWQTNYSNILGSLAAGGISNLYYPEQDRNGAGLTFENGAIGLGATAIGNLFQEFFVRKLTPKRHKEQP